MEEGIQSLRERRFGSYVHTYTQRDCILYALAIGCTTAKDLPYVYEGFSASAPLPNTMGLKLMPFADQAAVSSDSAIVASTGRDTGETRLRLPLGRQVAVVPFPSWAIVAAHPALLGVPLEHYVPGFDKNKALHGEQWMQLLAPIPPAGQLVTRPQLIDVRDKGKGKGVVVIVRTTTADALSGAVVALSEFTIFALGAGGFGSPWPPYPRPASSVRDATPPSRPPDFEACAPTTPDQAALYRVASGDWNPLHIDQRAASAAGLPSPIMHGLCSLGIAVRLVAQEVAQGDASRVRSIKARFAAPCFPGETLHVRIWKDGCVPDARACQPQQAQRVGAPNSVYPNSSSSNSKASAQPASSHMDTHMLERYVFEVSVDRSGQQVAVVRNAAVELAATGWQGGGSMQLSRL